MEGDWLGNPANIKGIGYCSILSRSRDNDRAIPFLKMASEITCSC